jgi:hypothetical protein
MLFDFLRRRCCRCQSIIIIIDAAFH